MSAFSRAPGGRSGARRYIARFTAQEAAVIRDLAGQVAELVSGTAGGGEPPSSGAAAEPGTGGNAGTGAGAGTAGEPSLPADAGMEEALGISERSSPPEDPVLARLLPDGYREDPDAAGEFRRYTERDLRDGKAGAARTVLETLPARGGRVTLTEDQAETWLRALNDVRLALGVRLEVTEELHEEMERMDPGDPRYGALSIYDWLTAVQESLVAALS